MASLYIEEYQSVGRDGGDNDLNIPGRLVTSQVRTITGTSAQSSAFSGKTNYVMVTSDIECQILFGASPTAVSTSPYLPAFVPRPFAVTPGWKVAAITKQ